MCIPQSQELRKQIISKGHDSKIAAHFGIEKTYQLLYKSFFWPNMYKDIEKYIRTCDSCQKSKPMNQSQTGLLQPLEIPKNCWSEITMDFITHLPRTKSGHDALFVIIDKLSKRMHIVPTRSTATAKDTAQLFFNGIFRHHGLPKKIVSDRDPKFLSSFWKELFKCLGTRLAMSTAYHPQTDGQTERANRVIEEALRSYTSHLYNDWDEYLTAIEFAYNNSKNASTKLTPFEVDTGRNPLIPSNLLISSAISKAPAASEFIKKFANNLKIAKNNLTLAQQRQSK
jgi:hypothetical protein